jgi:hypothetical protein
MTRASIRFFAKRMDCRVKPGNDVSIKNENALIFARAA